MKIGVFADVHDHLDHLRSVVDLFNDQRCELVVFAGDLVSTIAIPPLRKLRCPLVGCFGDNEGNHVGVRSGMSVVGTIANPPFGYRAADGTRLLVTHQRQLVRGFWTGCDVLIYGHTHRASVTTEADGTLVINPGETGGWTYGRPSVAILHTAPLTADIVRL